MRKVIEVALQEVGYKETGKNITKYSKDFDMKYTDFYNTKKQGAEWCDIFVDWCFVTAYGEAKALELLYQPKKSCGAGCKYSANYFRSKNAFVKRGQDLPHEGDQIFFGAYGEESHTGLVKEVKDGRVYTIEGNSNDAVREKNYSLSYNKISGYGRPDWKVIEETPAPTPAPTPKKSVTEIAKEVIAGKWGNGDARKKNLTAAGYDYNEVQAEVNRLLGSTKPKTTKYRVKVNSVLNVRKGPGTQYNKVYALSNGTVVEVTEVKNGWAHLTNGYWCSASYLTKI